MPTPTSGKSVVIGMHQGKVVSITGKHDPLQQVKYLLAVAEKSGDQHVIDAARDVLAQVTQLTEQKLDLSLPGDQNLLAGYKKLRGDYLGLVSGFRQMHESNERYRAEVVAMGRALAEHGVKPSVEYLRAIAEDTTLPNAQSTNADWPDSSTTDGTRAK